MGDDPKTQRHSVRRRDAGAVTERSRRLDDCCIRRNVESLGYGVAGVSRRYGISNRCNPGASQRPTCSASLPSKSGRCGHRNCPSNSLCMRVRDLGAQTRLIAYNLQGLVGEVCPERRYPHRCPIAERPHATKSDLAEQTPVEPLLYSTENSIGALAIVPIELHSSGETF